MENILLDLSLVIVIATILGFLALKLKQPLILGYVLGGIILGPILGIVKTTEPLLLLSELGVALLLFAIGLELDFKRIREVGVLSAIIGLLQVTITTIVSLFLLHFFNLPLLTAFYFSLLVSFSSTIVVVKLLHEKKELESLHGELALGILVIQDIIAVLILSFLPLINNFSINTITPFILHLIEYLIIIFLISKYFLKWFLRQITKYTDLTFISALTFVFLLGFLAQIFDLSFSIGAFIAGVLFSSSITQTEVLGRIKPLKDFFIVLFFATFGMQIVFDNITLVLKYLIPLLILVLILKPIIIYFISKLFGYGFRTGILTALVLAQSGEFALVLSDVGFKLGHLKPEDLSIISFIVLITMTLSAYIIKYDQKLYEIIVRKLKFNLDEHHYHKEYLEKHSKKLKDHYIIFGYHLLSEGLIERLEEDKKTVLIVDHNPEKIKELYNLGKRALLLELDNVDAYEKLNLHKAKAVISTINHLQGNLTLIRHSKLINPKVKVIVTTNNEHDYKLLKEAGADFVALPLFLAGKEMADHILMLTDIHKREKLYPKLIRELEKIKEHIKKVSYSENRIEEYLEKTIVSEHIKKARKDFQRKKTKEKKENKKQKDKNKKSNKKNIKSKKQNKKQKNQKNKNRRK